MFGVVLVAGEKICSCPEMFSANKEGNYSTDRINRISILCNGPLKVVLVCWLVHRTPRVYSLGYAYYIYTVFGGFFLY